MRYSPGMDATTLLTEREAAARIGWTHAGLRSHRERHDLALLAERLPPNVAQLVRTLGGTPPARQLRRLKAQRGTELVGEPWALATEGPAGWQKLNAKGIEVARALHYGRRPTEPPPSVRIEHGVRYREDELQAWLDQHPAAQERGEMLTEQDVATAMGIDPAVMKAYRYRASTAAARLAVTSRAAHQQKGESRAGFLARRRVLPGLEREADVLPPGHKVGRVWRYRAEDVKAWQARHPEPTAHPLLVQRDPARGGLLTHDEAAARMRIEPQTLVAARYRAGAAARELALTSKAGRRRRATASREAETREEFEARLVRLDRLRQLADAAPPHVLVDGKTCYQRLDVKDWLKRRAEREA